MTELKPQTMVRVRQLIHPLEGYDARQGFNKRPPQVGDIGRVLQVLHIAARPDADAYAVESISSQDGAPIWFGAFSPEELEPLGGVTNEATALNGGPAKPPGNLEVPEGPPSVS